YRRRALAAFGRPSCRRRLEELFQIFGDGSFALALNPLAVSSAWQSPDEERLQSMLGIPPRPSGAALTQEHFDLARSLQEMTEDAVLGLLLERAGEIEVLLGQGRTGRAGRDSQHTLQPLFVGALPGRRHRQRVQRESEAAVAENLKQLFQPPAA